MAASSRTSVRSRAAARPDLIGSTLPRIYTPPLVTGKPGPCGCGCALSPSTSLGFDCVEFAEDVLGLVLFPWQRWLLIHALELLPDGTPRFRTVLLLVARQNGKSTLMMILALFVMYVQGRKLVIGTAQSLDVAEEVWQETVDLAEANDELRPEIEKVSQVNGKKFLRLWTGERYRVAAASRKGGRGLSADLILLDELREHQNWNAWAAVSNTTMARALAQVWAASNAGDATSVVLRFLRKMAHLELGDPDGLAELDEIVEGVPDEDLDDEWDDEDGDLFGDQLNDLEDDEPDDSVGIFEWSARPGCKPRDRQGWCQANPSLGHPNGITVRAIRSAAKQPEWVFRTENLCQWVDTTIDGPFPPTSWEECGDESSEMDPDSRVAFCVDVSWDRSVAHVAVAGWRSDGMPQVEVVASRLGTEWVVDWLTATEFRRGVPVAVQSSGAPASSLVEPMQKAGVVVKEWSGSDLGAATGEFYDRVRAAVGEGPQGEDGRRARLRHLHQPGLDTAAANAVTRPLGEAFAWDRKHSPVDVSPLVAATGALWLLMTFDEEEVSELW